MKLVKNKWLLVNILIIIVSILVCRPLLWEQGEKRFILIFIVIAVLMWLIYFIKNRINKKTYNELLIISIYPLFLSIVIFMVKSQVICFSSNVVSVIIIVAAVCACIIGTRIMSTVGMQVSDKDNKSSKEGILYKSYCFIKQNKWILSVLIIAFLLRLPFITQLQRWDGGEYYYRYSEAVSTYTFSSLAEYIDMFALCNHTTLGFSFIYMAGELLFPYKVIGVAFTNIVLTLIALYCLYKLLLIICSKLNRFKVAVCVFLLSMAPLFMGFACYFSPDYTLAVLFIILLYTCYANQYLLTGVISFLCMQTKETGIVLVGGLVIGIFVRHIVMDKANGILKKIFTDGKLYLILLSTIMHGCYYLLRNPDSGWTQAGDETLPLFRWNSTGSNCFGFNTDYIGLKLRQMYVLNFNWIVAAFILLCLVMLLIKYKGQIIRRLYHFQLWEVFGAGFAYILFSSLFITAPIVRYGIVMDLLLYITAFYVYSLVDAYIIKQQNERKKIVAARVEKAAIIIFIAIISVQGFITIDPLSKCAFETLNAGNRTILYTGCEKDISERYYGDFIAYNCQYTYIERTYDTLLQEIGFKPEKMNILLPISNDCFVAGNIPLYYLNWDNESKKRCFYVNENTIQMKKYILTSSINSILQNKQGYINSGMLYDKAVFIVNPYWKGIVLEKEISRLSLLYNISEQHIIKTFQGSIIYYELELKN